jgi:hypothetical protein
MVNIVNSGIVVETWQQRYIGLLEPPLRAVILSFHENFGENRNKYKILFKSVYKASTTLAMNSYWLTQKTDNSWTLSCNYFSIYFYLGVEFIRLGVDVPVYVSADSWSWSYFCCFFSLGGDVTVFLTAYSWELSVFHYSVSSWSWVY